MTLRAQVLSGLRWTVSVRLISQLITWAITLVVIRLLTPADYGLVAMATVFISLLAMVSDFGLGSALVQRVTVGDSELSNVFGLVLLVQFTLAALLVASAPLIALFFSEPKLVPIVRVMALQFIVAAFAVVPDALLRRAMEFRKRSIFDLTSVLVGSVMTLLLAVAGAGVWALVAGNLAAVVWRTVGLNLFAPSFVRPTLSIAGMWTILQFGGLLTASQVLWFFSVQADVVVAGKWLGKEALGAYSVAMHLASLPNDRISGLINQLAFPAFSRMQHDVAKVVENLLFGVRVLSLGSFPVLWGIASVAPEIVTVFLGPKWNDAVVPLQILALIMPLRLVGSFVPNATLGIGRSDIIFKNALLAALLMPTAFVIGVNWGLMGLSIAWVIIVPVLLRNLMRSAAALGLRVSDFLLALARPVLAAGLMYGVVAGTRALLFDTSAGPVGLFLLVLVGALAYLAASWFFNRSGIREFLHLIREAASVRLPRSAAGDARSGNDGGLR